MFNSGRTDIADETALAVRVLQKTPDDAKRINALISRELTDCSYRQRQGVGHELWACASLVT
jgi:hypothetical protein